MTSPQRLQRLEIPTTPGEATVLSVWLVVDMQGKLRVTERKEVSPFRDVPLFSVLVCIEGEPVKEAPQFIESLHEFCKDGKPFAVIYQLPENAIDPCVPLEEDATLPGIDVEVPIDGPIDAMLSIFRERVLVMRVSATSFPGVPLWSEVTAIKGRETEGRLKGTALLNEISRLANAEKQTFTVWVRTPPYADKLNLGRVRLLNERSLVTGVRSPVTVSVVWPRDAAQGALHDDSWAQPLPTESQMLQAMWGAGQVLQDAAAPRMNEAVHLWYTDLGDVPGIAEQNICLGATKESILDGLKRLNTKFEDESVPHPRHAHLVALVGEATPDGGFATASQPMYARELLQALDGCNAQVLIVCDAPGFTCELHYAGTAPQAPNCRITVIGLESVNEGQYHRGGLLCSLCTVYHYGLAVDALNMMAAYLAPTHKLFVASTDPLPQDALCISDPVRQQHGWHKANLQAARSEAEAKARLASLAKALMSDPQQVAYLTDAAKTKAQAEAAYRMLLIKYAGGAEPEEALYTLVVDQVHEMLDNYRVDDDSGEDKEGLINYINGKEFTQHAWDDFVAIYEDMKKQKLRQRIEAVGMRDSVEDMLMCRGVRYLGDVALAAATDVPIALKKPTRAVYVWMKAEGGHAELDEVSPVLRALWSSGVGLMGDADDATWSDLALPSRRLVHLPLNPEGLTGKSVLLEHPGFLPPTKEEIVKAIEWLAEDTTADDSLLIVLLGDAGADGGYHTLSGTLHERDIFAPLQGVHPDAHVTLISDTTSPVGRMHFNEEAVPPKLPCHFVAFGYDPDESQARHTVGDIFIPYAMAMAHDTCTIRTSSELRGFDKALNLICAAVPHQVVVFCTSSGPLKSHTNVIGNHRVLHESGQNWYKAFLGPFNHEDSSGMGYLMEVGWLCHRHAEHLDDVEARLQNQYGGRWSAGIRELAKLYLHGPLHVVNDVWHFVNQLSRSPLTAEGAEEVCRRVLSQDMWDEIVASFHKTHGRSLCNKLLNLDDSIANRFLARGLFFQRHGEYFCTAVPETAAYARSTPTSAPSGLRSAGSAIGVGAGQEAPEMVRNASQQSDSDAGSRYVQQQSLRSNNGAAPTASLQQSLRSDSGAAPTAIAPDAVTVTVLGATGLPDKDLIGKSDPYAVLEMDGFPKAQTKTVDGTHEPVWNKEVHYDLTKLPLYAPSDTLTMGITVYDQDVGGRDLLGKGALLLTPQLLQRSVAQGEMVEVPLSGKGVVQCIVNARLPTVLQSPLTSHKFGDSQVSASMPAPPASVGMAEVSSAVPSVVPSGRADPLAPTLGGPVSFRSEGVAASANANTGSQRSLKATQSCSQRSLRPTLSQRSDVGLSRQTSVRAAPGGVPVGITVMVMGATGLPDKDLIGKSDPYAVLEMDGFPKAQTKTVDGTHEPVWNKEVHYDLTKLPLYAPSDTLTMGITVYDQDVGGRDLLGKGALLLTPQLLQRSVDESVEHVGLSHGGVVQCMVKVHLMATQTSMPAPPPSPPPVAALSPSGHNVCHVGVQAFASQTSVPSRREPEPMKEEPARQASMGVPSAVGSLPAEEERVGSGGAPYMTSRLSPLRYASPVSPREGFDALFLTDMPAPFNKITPTFALKTPSASQRQPSQSLSPPLMPPEPSILREMDFRPLSMPQPASPVPAKRVSGTDPTATLPRNMGSVINLTRPSGAAAFRSPLPPPSTTYRKPNFNHVNSQL